MHAAKSNTLNSPTVPTSFWWSSIGECVGHMENEIWTLIFNKNAKKNQWWCYLDLVQLQRYFIITYFFFDNLLVKHFDVARNLSFSEVIHLILLWKWYQNQPSILGIHISMHPYIVTSLYIFWIVIIAYIQTASQT